MQVLFVRAIILYVTIIAAMRAMGKRQLGQLSASEFVVAMMISELASIPMQDNNIPLLYGLIPIIVLVGLEYISTFGALKSLRFRAIVSGRPAIVLREGKIDQRELHKSRMSVDELIEELRKKGITDLDTLRYVILEPGGEVSAIRYSADDSATPKDLGVTPKEHGLPMTIISDGRVIGRNLALRGMDRSGLEKWLRENGHPSPEGIFLMTIDDSGKIYVERREEN